MSEYLDTLDIEEITKVFVLNKSLENMFDIPKWNKNFSEQKQKLIIPKKFFYYKGVWYYCRT